MSPLRKAAEAAAEDVAYSAVVPFIVVPFIADRIEAVAREHCRKIAQAAQDYLEAANVCRELRGSGSPYSDWARKMGDAERELNALVGCALASAEEEQP